MRSSLMGKGNEMGTNTTLLLFIHHKFTNIRTLVCTHKTVTCLYQIGACWYLFVYIYLLTCAIFVTLCFQKMLPV